MQTIGERLEEARKRKGITIREAAEATKIRGDYLQKFENSQFDIGLSDIYVRGFLRTYSHFLKLPAERIVADFNALNSHAGESARPRQVNREVYGRMDLSIASSAAAKAKEPGQPQPPEPAPAAEPSQKLGNTIRKFARIGTSLPEGPFIDQRVIIKLAATVVGVLVVFGVIWGIRSVGSHSTKTEAKAPAAASAAPQAAHTITLFALDNVRIKLSLKRSANDDQGEQIFQGTMMRGETRTFPKNGPLYLTASELQNLDFQIDNGKRWSIGAQGYKGYDRVEIP